MNIDKAAQDGIGLRPDLSCTVTFGAGYGRCALPCTRSLTVITGFIASYINLLFDTKGCLFEFNGHFILKVAALLRSASLTAAAAENSAAEDIFKYILKAAPAKATEAAK